jgi:hypothetical protein
MKQREDFKSIGSKKKSFSENVSLVDREHIRITLMRIL